MTIRQRTSLSFIIFFLAVLFVFIGPADSAGVSPAGSEGTPLRLGQWPPWEWESLKSAAASGDKSALKIMVLRGDTTALQKLHGLASSGDVDARAWLDRMITDGSLWSADGLLAKEWLLSTWPDYCPDAVKEVLAFNGDAESLKALQRVASSLAYEPPACLGFIYERGFGVRQNYETAVNLYRLTAARNSRSVANISLGHLYFYGHGVQQDYAEAYYWLTLGEESGHLHHAPPSSEDAYSHLDILQKTTAYLRILRTWGRPNPVIYVVVFMIGIGAILSGENTVLRYSLFPNFYRHLFCIWTSIVTISVLSGNNSPPVGLYDYGMTWADIAVPKLRVLSNDLAMVADWLVLLYLDPGKVGIPVRAVVGTFENKRLLKISQFIAFLLNLNALGYLALFLAEMAGY